MDNKCHKKVHDMGMTYACPMMCCLYMCPMMYQAMCPMMGMGGMNMPMPMMYPTTCVGNMQHSPMMGVEAMHPPTMKSMDPMCGCGMQHAAKPPMMNMMGEPEEKDIYGIKMRTVDISEIED